MARTVREAALLCGRDDPGELPAPDPFSHNPGRPMARLAR
jgi:hypothetical protein